MEVCCEKFVLLKTGSIIVWIYLGEIAVILNRTGLLVNNCTLKFLLLHNKSLSMDSNWGPNFTKFKGKRLLCVDYGTKKAGLAMITPGREPFPIPYGTIAVFDEHWLLVTLKKFLEEDAIDVVVMGLPLLLDGKETSMTLKVRRFGELLAKESGIPVFFQDETLSSFEAIEKLKDLRNQGIKPDMTQVDTIAAMLILEDFLRADS